MGKVGVMFGQEKAMKKKKDDICISSVLTWNIFFF